MLMRADYSIRFAALRPRKHHFERRALHRAEVLSIRG